MNAHLSMSRSLFLVFFSLQVNSLCEVCEASITYFGTIFIVAIDTGLDAITDLKT